MTRVNPGDKGKLDYEDAYIALGALTECVGDSQGKLRTYRVEVQALMHCGVSTIQDKEVVDQQHQ